MTKKTVAELKALEQILPALRLALKQAEELKRELELLLVAQTKESHQKAKIQVEIPPP